MGDKERDMYKFAKEGANIWDSELMQKEGVKCYSRLLYMYLLSCNLSNVLGVYEISAERIKSDLRIDSNELKTAQAELKALKKVRRAGKFIIIQDAIHYVKHDAKTFKEIGKIISYLPEKVRERLPKKTMQIIDDYQKKAEERRIARIKKKIEQTEKCLFDLDEAVQKNAPSFSCDHFTRKVEKEEIAQKGDERDVKASIDSEPIDNEPINSETVLPSWESFTVLPSEASLKACNNEGSEEGVEEKQEKEEASSVEVLSFSRFLTSKSSDVPNKSQEAFTLEILPSQASIAKMQKEANTKKKAVMSDEVMFPLLQKKLAPIYAKMRGRDSLPNCEKEEIEKSAYKAIVAFIKENKIKVEPLDKSWFDTREFMRQAYLLSGCEETKRENEVIVQEAKKFSNDAENVKEMARIAMDGAKFAQDEENIRIRNDMDFLNKPKTLEDEKLEELGLQEKKKKCEWEKTALMGDKRMAMSKEEFDNYIKSLNETMDEENEAVYKKDEELIQQAWDFYLKFEKKAVITRLEFCDHFEIAKSFLIKAGEDVSTVEALKKVLVKLNNYIQKHAYTHEKTVPFHILAHHYAMEKTYKATYNC